MQDFLAARKKYISLAQKYKVAVHELDFTENLKPVALLQYFQDIATDHANILGVGHSDMLKKGLFWVLSRVSYRIFKSLSYGSEIEIVTFPQKPRRADVNRIYYVLDSGGGLVASGTSKWCVLNSATRSIARMDGIFNIPDEKFNDAEPFENGNPPLPPPDFHNLLKVKVSDNIVQISDLDKNRHMNNARYGDAVLNCLSIEELDKNRIKALDINYLSELKYGERFLLTRGNDARYSYFEAVRNGGGSEAVFRAKIEW